MDVYPKILHQVFNHFLSMKNPFLSNIYYRDMARDDPPCPVIALPIRCSRNRISARFSFFFFFFPLRNWISLHANQPLVLLRGEKIFPSIYSILLVTKAVWTWLYAKGYPSVLNFWHIPLLSKNNRVWRSWDWKFFFLVKRWTMLHFFFFLLFFVIIIFHDILISFDLTEQFNFQFNIFNIVLKIIFIVTVYVYIYMSMLYRDNSLQ